MVPSLPSLLSAFSLISIVACLVLPLPGAWLFKSFSLTLLSLESSADCKFFVGRGHVLLR